MGSPPALPGDSPRFDLYVGLFETSISTKRRSFRMKEYQSLSHTRWDCKYHIVFIPKKRNKQIYVALRKYLGEIFHELAQQKECKVVEGRLMRDHVHICLSMPPKYTVSNVVGYMKGKSAISIARQFGGRQRNFTGEVFWARILCRLLGWMRKWFGLISVIKQVKMIVMIR